LFYMEDAKFTPSIYTLPHPALHAAQYSPHTTPYIQTPPNPLGARKLISYPLRNTL